MADTDKTVAYGISADAAGFERGMQQAADAAKNAASSIDNEFKKVQAVFGNVQKQLIILASVVAGGAFFKDAIDKSNQLTGEVVMLSKALGVSTQSASVLNVALKSIGSSAETYTAANAKLTKQIRTNEDGVKAMGVQTRGANGELLSGQAIMTNAITALKGYKEGTDRNLAAQTLFGRGAGEVTALLKLNTDVMDKAAIKARELGMVLGPEQVANTKAYKEGINQVKLVLEAVENQIGQAVMPTFTKLAEWFAATGPAVIQTFRPVMQAVADIFSLVIDVARELGSMIKDVFLGIGSIISSVAGEDTPSALTVWTNAMILVRVAALGLKEGIVLAFEIIRGAVLVAVENIKSFASVARAAFMLDWEGVKSAWAGGVANVEKVLADSQKRILDKTAETADQMQRILMGGSLDGPKSGNADAPKGTRSYQDPKAGGAGGADKSRTSAWETELAEQKLHFQERMNLEGSFAQFGKQAELKFWSDKLAVTVQGSAENITVRRKLADLQLTIGQEAYQREIAALGAQEAAYKNNTDAKMALVQKEADLVSQRFGTESKEFEAVQKKMVEIKRQAVEQQKQMDIERSQGARNAALAELQGREQLARLDLALHNTTQLQMLAAQESFEKERNAIVIEGLNARKAIALQGDSNPVEVEKIKQEELQSERQHQAALGQIRNAATLEQSKNFLALGDNIRAGFENSMAGMLQGTMTLQKGMQATWNSILQGFSQFISKKVTAWALGETTQTGATVMGNATRTASDWMAATQSTIANAWSAAKNIAMKAWEVAASVYAAIAAIPYVGPFIAPVMALAAAGTVMGFASHIASAEGGYDIPGTINPITQLHANEMVLPAKHADVIRNMADNDGQQRGGGGGAVNVSISAHPMPGNYFMVHRDHLIKALKSAQRDNAWKPA